MDIYQTALLIGACIAALLNINQPRALVWIGVGAADFALTDLYYFHQIPWLPHPFVTGVADATVVIALATYGLHRWERLVRYAFIGMVGVSAAYLWGIIHDRTTYAEWLEVANWLALLFIGGTGMLRLLDGFLVEQGSRSGAGGGLHSARRFFDAERRPKGVIAKALRQT